MDGSSDSDIPEVTYQPSKANLILNPLKIELKDRPKPHVLVVDNPPPSPPPASPKVEASK